mmetsp:Transcript_12759/g.28014  ORF Transcript_12759/g.28014 Transcript_12759/m.28014 type:complete len:397 (+) Transcript_12759:433-1623(+)
MTMLLLLSQRKPPRRRNPKLLRPTVSWTNPKHRPGGAAVRRAAMGVVRNSNSHHPENRPINSHHRAPTTAKNCYRAKSSTLVRTATMLLPITNKPCIRRMATTNRPTIANTWRIKQRRPTAPVANPGRAWEWEPPPTKEPFSYYRRCASWWCLDCWPWRWGPSARPWAFTIPSTTTRTIPRPSSARPRRRPSKIPPWTPFWNAGTFVAARVRKDCPVSCCNKAMATTTTTMPVWKWTSASCWPPPCSTAKPSGRRMANDGIASCPPPLPNGLINWPPARLTSCFAPRTIWNATCRGEWNFRHRTFWMACRLAVYPNMWRAPRLWISIPHRRAKRPRFVWQKGAVMWWSYPNYCNSWIHPTWHPESPWSIKCYASKRTLSMPFPTRCAKSWPANSPI